MENDYVTTNREIWNDDAPNWVAIGERLWAKEIPIWGNWGISEQTLQLLPTDMANQDAIELGCGTGYVSAWMVRRGANVTGIDISVQQLSTAHRLALQHHTNIRFLEADAEKTGLDSNAFDFAISEYGAAIWCKPELWLREAWRLLRPGGKLVFLGNHPLVLLCSPLDGSSCDKTLHRPYIDMWGADWTKVKFDPSGVCFNLTMSAWMKLFREIGFEIDNYQEIFAPESETQTRACIPADWAKQFPVEQVWHLAKPS